MDHLPCLNSQQSIRQLASGSWQLKKQSAKVRIFMNYKTDNQDHPKYKNSNNKHPPGYKKYRSHFCINTAHFQLNTCSNVSYG